MKDKNGFISMTLVYTFLIVFLFVMLSIITSYSDKNKYLNTINDKINMDISTSKNNKNMLINKMLEDNTVVPYVHGEENEKGLYYIDDSLYLRRIYFYRGNVSNNYVLFGKDASGSNDLCWRIIRSNEDGTIRLIYNGVASNSICNNDNIFITTNSYTKFSINGTKKNDNAYVGFTYGDAGQNTFDDTHYGNTSSSIKNYLNTWFINSTNLRKYMDYSIDGVSLVVKNERVLGDSIFCVDRTLSSGTGLGSTLTTYGSKGRINSAPSLVCNAKDSYSISVKNGGYDAKSYALDYPVGLITVDEARLAGATSSGASTTYLKNPNDAGFGFWTLSPADYTSDGARVYYIDASGNIIESLVTEFRKIRPVISVKQTAKAIYGDGQIDSPYVIRGGN